MKNRALAYVEKALQNGDTEFYFRVEGRNVASDVAEKVNDRIGCFFYGKEIVGKRTRMIANNAIGTCWIEVY